jgi:hypothetical protein
MKSFIAAVIAVAAIASTATVAQAMPHRHHVKVCTMHHHHRVCTWAWR